MNFYLGGMEGRGEEVTDAEGVYLERKECNHHLKPDTYNIIEPPEMLISTTVWPDNLLQVSTDTLEDKGVKRCLAESNLPCSGPCSTNDAGAMVEELTFKNYEKSKLSIIGSSSRAEALQGRKGQWQHLYNLAGGFGNGNSRGNIVSKDKEPVTTSGGEVAGNTFFPEFRAQKHFLSKQSNQGRGKIPEHVISSDRNTVSKNVLSPRETPAKASSTSGFSQFFVKSAQMENRVECRDSEACERFGPAVNGQDKGREFCVSREPYNALVNASAEINHLALRNVSGPCCLAFHEGINLREWLKPGCRKVNKAKSLHIFGQIVVLVDKAHSQQVVLQDVRPSHFELLPSKQVKYVGPLAPRELVESVDQGIHHSEHHLSRKRNLEHSGHAHSSLYSKHKFFGKTTKYAKQHTCFLATSGFKSEAVKEADVNSIDTQNSGYATSEEYNLKTVPRAQKKFKSPSEFDTAQQKFTSLDFQLEDKWYTSPEELKESGSTFSSNIYSLGVLLFELFCCFESLEVHDAAMSDLRHRILSPNFLSENPKLAGFCLWLLHPEPSSRPTTREILQSKLICESQELSTSDQFSAPVDEDEAESELLLHFLATLRDEKQKKASRLVEDIRCLEADLEEVGKRHLSRTGGILTWSHKESSSAGELGFNHKEPLSFGALSRSLSMSDRHESKLTRNMNQLETAYFSMRSQMQLQDTDSIACLDNDLIEKRYRWSLVQNENDEVVLKQKPTDRLGAFFDGLCKYARYSKFELRAILRNGDLLNAANVICSLSFDRDEDYFAAAGVSKKIKIFDFHSLLNESVDIHYPVTEMTGKSKLSCVCWNNYIKNYLASTDYDGDIQLWDANTGQVVSQYMEHEKRAWSADFSQVDPQKLASGSDDYFVKLWSINEQRSISTIRSIANVCCVQFSSHSTNLLAFGSADYKTYCYDLRNTRIPWCTLAGHGKAVSYVKFLDSGTLVSASTDNTLKLWDLNKTSSSGLSTSACSLTFSGHTNEKNFVGLSVSDGYIACGSETNEVYAYHSSLPMPITSFKFGSIDPISGQETGDDNGQFVSSVCWRGKSNMVVTANSSGSIKLLQMV